LNYTSNSFNYFQNMRYSYLIPGKILSSDGHGRLCCWEGDVLAIQYKPNFSELRSGELEPLIIGYKSTHSDLLKFET